MFGTPIESLTAFASRVRDLSISCPVVPHTCRGIASVPRGIRTERFGTFREYASSIRGRDVVEVAIQGGRFSRLQQQRRQGGDSPLEVHFRARAVPHNVCFLQWGVANEAVPIPSSSMILGLAQALRRERGTERREHIPADRIDMLQNDHQQDSKAQSHLHPDPAR